MFGFETVRAIFIWRKQVATAEKKQGNSRRNLAVIFASLCCTVAISAPSFAKDLPRSVEHQLYANTDECWKVEVKDKTGIHWIEFESKPSITNTEARGLTVSRNASVTTQGSSIVIKRSAPYGEDVRLTPIKPCPPLATAVSTGLSVSLLAGGSSARSAVEDANPNGNGVVAGGSLGFTINPSIFRGWPTNVQPVVGVEATFLGTGISGSNLGITSKLPWISFINGQAGLSFINVIPIYPFTVSMVGGFAFGDVKVSSGGVSDSKVMNGFDIGGKADWYPVPNFRMGVEVLYFNLGSTTMFNGSAPVSERGTLVLGTATWSVSDVRLKQDIVPLARLDNGLGLYRFRYWWSDQQYVGVMAQEVAAIIPEAVAQAADGYLRVNYDRLGLKFQTWEDWFSDTSL